MTLIQLAGIVLAVVGLIVLARWVTRGSKR